jgi:small subunit ribosomal protein S20
MKNLIKEEQNREQNRKYKSLMKNNSKKFKFELEKSTKENASNLKNILVSAQKNIDKSANKGIIHKNTAARRNSKLSKLFNSLNK